MAKWYGCGRQAVGRDKGKQEENNVAAGSRACARWHGRFVTNTQRKHAASSIREREMLREAGGAARAAQNIRLVCSRQAKAV